MINLGIGILIGAVLAIITIAWLFRGHIRAAIELSRHMDP